MIAEDSIDMVLAVLSIAGLKLSQTKCVATICSGKIADKALDNVFMLFTVLDVTDKHVESQPTIAITQPTLT